SGDHLKTIEERDYTTRESRDLEGIVRHFLDEVDAPAIISACFGIAGPVREGVVRTTNLPWIIDAAKMSRDLSIRSVLLINDLEATAFGIEELAEGDLAMLAPGDPAASGNAAVIAAGTGLGEAGIYWDGNQRRPFGTEGGHSSFAPSGEMEIDLLRHLTEQFGHVSWERVLSGPGLHNIYMFLRDTGRGEESEWLAAEMRDGDPAATISRAALEGRSSLCTLALDLFVSLYGSEAGNVALKTMATGGLYVGGGIAPKIIDKLKGPAFMKAFVGKGRFQAFLEAIPVRVILNDRTALLGAARRAAGAKARG
ncbi:MAG: glucokinase, partial [Acidobacteria bacterium]|nr:glucokinase [Acidobacteriota bacterium]